MTSSNPNYVLMPSYWGKVSTYEFGGNTNIQSIIVTLGGSGWK